MKKMILNTNVRFVGCCIDREAIADTVSVSSRSFWLASMALIAIVWAVSFMQGQCDI